MLINVSSVTEDGIEDKSELLERCDFVKQLGDGDVLKPLEYAKKAKIK